MAYLSCQEMKDMGFKRLGRGVKISSKASIYDCQLIELSDHCRIDDYCVISGKVAVGRFCHITPMCLIAGGTPGVYLEDFVTLAYGVKVFAQSDDYSGMSLTNSLIPDKYKKEVRKEVRLGRHVIIGAGSVVLPGVNIAEGCSLGAMSLAKASTAPWGIYAGIPARRIKERSRDLLELEKRFLQEQDSHQA